MDTKDDAYPKEWASALRHNAAMNEFLPEESLEQVLVEALNIKPNALHWSPAQLIKYFGWTAEEVDAFFNAGGY